MKTFGGVLVGLVLGLSLMSAWQEYADGQARRVMLQEIPRHASVLKKTSMRTGMWHVTGFSNGGAGWTMFDEHMPAHSPRAALAQALTFDAFTARVTAKILELQRMMRGDAHLDNDLVWRW